MPAPLTSSPPRSASPKAMHKSRTRMPRSRLIRRRGRARDGIESDDEIERVLSTDSESDSDSPLSPDSETDSDQESASEDGILNKQANDHTPDTSHSSGAPKTEVASNGKTDGALFSTSGDWSEMVADEGLNGSADLPVIEFSDFKETNVHPTKVPQRREKRTNKKKIQTPLPIPATQPKEPASESVGTDAVEKVDEQPQDTSHPQPSHLRRPFGQSARQAYQRRLESDPSFVPKVGGFWGHDDRLMDRELRSLSGWWRGKWQGRARGRAGYPVGNGRPVLHQNEAPKEENANLPPIERAWTHDGFEEMRRKEDQRTELRAQHPATGSPLRGAPRGRGNLIAGRAGCGGLPRGGFVNSESRAAAAAKAGRVWYAMKPELMWTKQSENFLFFESSKHRTGTAFRIQLPGSRSQVIKAPPAPVVVPKHVTVTTASVAGSDVGDMAFVVNLPSKEEITVDETPLDDVFTVRPRLVNVEPIPLPAPSNTKSTKSSSPADKPTQSSEPSTSATSRDAAIRTQLEQLSLEPASTDPTHWAQTEEAVLRKPAGGDPAGEATEAPSSEGAPRRPSLPPIQTVYSPPPAQPSPAYPSTYSYPTLPPGIALNLHGVPYEVATGRPVYIPPPVYNSRPIMHSHMPQQSISYMSTPHMHPSPAIASDFAHHPPSHPHTPSGPANGFLDPATGAPVFSFPRAARVEIRAPGDDGSESLQNGNVKSSNSPSHSGVEYGYHSYGSSSDAGTLPSYAPLPDANAPSDATSNAPPPQAMMQYPAYQQYYYPEAPYGYTQYVGVSQTGQYEMYVPMEVHGTTYY
ncbi:hypothetical protein Agabi119p4_4147 [Agaricus bisporus var. burnettii]|uniref:Btz domain-containing protein n=1 Tax=Agaricus bisporus var. burnettii TaxID=192524 RepID=A0A8H7KGP4_AGABI|nr:hypothetical protein Agabi119p4_4147 [Agaricus bisporus var. burnettii]